MLNTGEEKVKNEQKDVKNPWVASPTPIRMQKMSASDDPEAYLHTFERVATAAGWPKEQWTLILTPCLTGVLQEVVDTLPTQEATQYETVKGAILQTLNLTEEAYRKKFRELKFKSGMHPRPVSQRMKANVIRWLKPEEKTKDEIIETFVMEHLISTLSVNMHSWVQRNRPKRLEEAISLIENYCAAEEGTKEHAGTTFERTRPQDKMATGSSNAPRGPSSFSVIGRGRPQNFEPMRPKPTRPTTYDQRLFEPGTGLKEGKDGKPVCFDCGRVGHVKREKEICAVMKSRRPTPPGGACEGVERESVPSAETKVEKDDEKKEQLNSSESNKEERKGLTDKEGEVKVEGCLAEGEWEESEVTVGGGYKDEEGVVWFSAVVEEYERKRREEKRQAFEKVRTQEVRTQGLIRDFPNLRVGGLLPNPSTQRNPSVNVPAKEWKVIVAPWEEELQRERNWRREEFDEGPDERGWIRHKCCGTICAKKSPPPPQWGYKKPFGDQHR
ncbi:uncharacterized protein LOC140703916 [Pogona vitticeps]